MRRRSGGINDRMRIKASVRMNALGKYKMAICIGSCPLANQRPVVTGIQTERGICHGTRSALVASTVTYLSR